MENNPVPARFRSCLMLCFVLLVFSFGIAMTSATVASAAAASLTEPMVYLDFNEGSGSVALDSSGHGSTATLTGTTRIASGGCGSAILFNGNGSYATIPFSSTNHPDEAITVSAWFSVDSFEHQTLVSTYRDGGYLLGFGDGDDLWWVVNTEGSGVVSVPVQHEGITLRQWHHVTGTYDGRTAKIYLDGSLRNVVNASGPIHYEYDNYVTLGTEAGAGEVPDAPCPQYLQGGLDEVRIYDTALEYSQVMDDRFRCSAEPQLLFPGSANVTSTGPVCRASSGPLHLAAGESATRTLLFSNSTVNGTWQVSIPPGSELVVTARDRYSTSYPDVWYIEIDDGKQRVDRLLAFPNTYNAPVHGFIPSGNATVLVRYFDGKYRFPASVEVTFQCIEPPIRPPEIISRNILANPSIVIYSASWATLIAVLVVVIWLHKRKRATPAKDDSEEPTTGDSAEEEEK